MQVESRRALAVMDVGVCLCERFRFERSVLFLRTMARFDVIFSARTAQIPFIKHLVYFLNAMSITCFFQEDISPVDNKSWQTQWFNVAEDCVKIVCLLCKDYPKSEPCCDEFATARKKKKHLVIWMDEPSVIETHDKNDWNGEVRMYATNGGQGIMRPADVETNVEVYKAFLRTAAEGIYKGVKGSAWTGGAIVSRTTNAR